MPVRLTRPVQVGGSLPLMNSGDGSMVTVHSYGCPALVSLTRGLYTSQAYLGIREVSIADNTAAGAGKTVLL